MQIENTESDELTVAIRNKQINLTSLTESELIFLGFQKFEHATYYLIPLWMLPHLPDGTKLMSILGKIKYVGTDYIDDDHRCGASAYYLVRNNIENI